MSPPLSTSGIALMRGRPVPSFLPAAWLTVIAAWVVVLLAEVTGTGTLLHHHTLIEAGIPLVLSVPAFLVGWQVMVAAMMVPASLPAIALFERASRTWSRPHRALAGFAAAYLLAWTAFGLFAFFGDFVLHHVVDATPWLAARPSLIAAGVVGLAGAYQFAPLKRRYLEACRHPSAPPRTAGSAPRDAAGYAAGLAHAVDCLGASWALMLLTFASGFANVWWMGALAALMVYEARGRHGQVAAWLAGAALIALAAGALLTGGLPAWGVA